MNPEVPDWLERIVRRLHEKSADARFQEATEVSELLERCLAHVQQPTVTRLPESLRHRTPPRDFRRRLWRLGFAASAFAVTCLMIGGSFYVGFQRTDATDVSDGQASKAELFGDHTDLSDEAVANEAQALNNELWDFEQRIFRAWDDRDSIQVPSSPRSRKSNP